MQPPMPRETVEEARSDGARAVRRLSRADAEKGARQALRGVRRFHAFVNRNTYGWILAALKEAYPEADEAVLKRAAQGEIERERAFQRKQALRLQKKLPKAFMSKDPETALTKVMEHEKRLVGMRQQAAAERAHAKMERILTKKASPDGAYWVLSPNVKKHTLDCLAMANKFWPWSVLDSVHPPLHPGCPCRLLSLKEAVDLGLMTADQVPDEEDAKVRAAKIASEFGLLQEMLAAPLPGDPTLREALDAHLDLLVSAGPDLREADWDEGVHPRDRRGRFRRVLRALLPHLPIPQSAVKSSNGGRWVWMHGKYTHVPEGVAWSRRTGGDVFSSPAGGTNVYKNGRLVSEPGKPATDVAMRRVAGKSKLPQEPPPPSREKKDLGPQLLDHPPSQWSDWAAEAFGWAQKLEKETGVQSGMAGIGSTGNLENSAGVTGWNGDIDVGVDIPLAAELLGHVHGDVSGLPDWQRGAVLGAYRAMIHEVLHTFNGPDKEHYAGANAAIEEALAEELSHVLGNEGLHRQKLDGIRAFALANPTDEHTIGVYWEKRRALGRVLDAAHVPPEEREEFLRNLKFKVPAEARSETLDALMRERGVGDQEREHLIDGLTNAWLFMEDNGDPRKFHPILRPDLSGVEMPDRLPGGTVVDTPEGQGVVMEAGEDSELPIGVQLADGIRWFKEKDVTVVRRTDVAKIDGHLVKRGDRVQWETSVGSVQTALDDGHGGWELTARTDDGRIAVLTKDSAPKTRLVTDGMHAPVIGGSDVPVEKLHTLPDYGKVTLKDGVEVEWIPRAPSRYVTGEHTDQDGYRVSVPGNDFQHQFVKDAGDVPAAVAKARAGMHAPAFAPLNVEDRLYSEFDRVPLTTGQHEALLKYADSPARLTAADRVALGGLVGSHSIPFDVRVARKPVAGELDNLKPGGVVTEDRFISTSVAESWGIGAAENHGTLQLHVPAGTRGYYNPGSYGTESEVIFAPGLRYRVDRVGERVGKPFVEATVLPEGMPEEPFKVEGDPENTRVHPRDKKLHDSLMKQAVMAAESERSWEGMPFDEVTGQAPKPKDTPPLRTPDGGFVVFHGTSEAGARAIEKDGVVKPDDLNMVGFATVWGQAQAFAAMKKGPILQMTIPPDDMKKLVVQREIGGSGHDQFLARGKDALGKKWDGVNVKDVHRFDPDGMHASELPGMKLGIPNYNAEKLKAGKPAGGSNDARWATDEHGHRWLVKPYRGNADRVATELLANAVYRDLGILVPEAGTLPVKDKKGKQATALAYPTLDGEVRDFPSGKAKWSDEDREKLGEGFMADALLASWDVIGLVQDNVLWTKDGPARLDQGGTFEYRAQGQKKTFGPVPSEVWTLLSPKGQAYGRMLLSDEDKRGQAALIAKRLTPARIDQLVDAAPFADQEMKERIRSNLKDRVKWMADYAVGKVSEPEPLTGADARAEMALEQQKVLKDLYPEEVDALGEFFSESLNTHLRSGKPKEDAPPGVQRSVKVLDKLLSMTKLPEDVIGFVPLQLNVDAEKVVGQTFKEPGYLSGTLDEAKAKAKAKTLVRLVMPAGARVFHPQGMEDAGFPAEPQWLGARGMRVKFVKAGKEDGVTVLDAVLLP